MFIVCFEIFMIVVLLNGFNYLLILNIYGYFGYFMKYFLIRNKYKNYLLVGEKYCYINWDYNLDSC